MEYTLVLTYEHVNCVRSWNFVGGGMEGVCLSQWFRVSQTGPPCESLATRD